MKKYLSTLLTVCLVTSTLYSQNSNYQLLLKHNTVNLAATTLPNFTPDEYLQGYAIRVLQFQNIPSEQEKNQMKQSGIHFYNYIPNNAFVAKISINTTSTQLLSFGVRSVYKLTNEDKMSKQLYEKNIPDWSKEGSSLLVKIKYLETIDEGLILSEVSTFGNIINSLPDYNLVELALNEEDLDDLIQKSFVLFAETVSPPDEKDDLEGNTLHRASNLKSAYATGRHYDGSGIVVSIADDGIVGPHIDFSGRMTQYATSDNGSHGDMTTGIMIGAGNIDPTIEGMAPGAYMHYYSITGYPHVINAVANYTNLGTVVTSTSYSQGQGGVYTTDTELIDEQIHDNPQLVHIFSAGNAGTSDHGYGAGAGWGNITGGYKAGKNTIACGNLNSTDALETSSSRGPADDGRIKPDICANGINQMSTDPNNSYAPGGGTSAASPGVAGVFTQLYQAYKELNGGQNPETGLIKACILNTAEDLGNPGPDFQHGWGRINALKAVRILEDARWLSDSIINGGMKLHTISVPSNVAQLRIMIYWMDVEGSAVASKALVNDINMQVIDPSATSYNPWILDPTPNATNLAAPATRGIDDLNNMEQVTIDYPVSGNYVVNVQGFQIPQGPQKYFICYDFIYDNIEVTYPNGGESFVPGSSEIIRWDAFGNTTTWKLEYSTDGGTNWSVIHPSLPASRRYHMWSSPLTISGKALIRVTRGAQSDISDSTFYIIDEPQNLNFSRVCPDTVQFDWGQVLGASHYEVSMLGTKYMDSVGTTANNFFKVAGINPFSEQWFSVKAMVGDSVVGRRALAIQMPNSIFGCTINSDVEALSLLNPTAGNLSDCYDLDSMEVKLILKNNGNSPITGFTAHYKLDALTTVTDTFTNSLAASTTDTFTFSQRIDLSNVGVHNLTCWTVFAGDQNIYNDTVSVQVTVVNGSLSTLPFAEDFELFSPCATSSNCESDNCTMFGGWINTANLNGDDIDWRSDFGGTPSFGTGPSTDFAPGTAGGIYLYLEASGSCDQRTGLLTSPCLDLRTAQLPLLDFAYHMSGTSMGELHVDVITEDGIDLDIIAPIIGDQGTSWINQTVNISAYIGKIINIRFRGITGNDYLSDIALDAISVYDNALPPIADFRTSSTSTCNNSEVVFTDLSQNYPTSWNWTFTPNTVTFLNGTNSTSQNPSVSFDSVGVYTVTLHSTNPFGTDSTVKTSYVTITAGKIAPFVEDFDAYANCSNASNCEATICNIPGDWTNMINGTDDDVDWRTYSGGTPSSGTGPTTDASGSSTGKYLYLEASGGCNGMEAYLISPCFNLTNGNELVSLSYHMYGIEMGELHIDMLNNNIWTLDVVSPLIGDKGNAWNTLQFSPGVTGNTVFRIVGKIGNGYRSDMAIDNFNVALPVGLNEFSNTNFIIFPNPATNDIVIKNTLIDTDVKIDIINVVGEKIVSSNAKSSELNTGKQLDISILNDGLYFIHIISDNHQHIEKLIVN